MRRPSASAALTAVLLGAWAAPASAHPAERPAHAHIARPPQPGAARSHRTRAVARTAQRAARPRRAVKTRGAILARLAHIAATVRSTRYSHQPRIDPEAGVYEFDCSGMLSYVLADAAPAAQAATVRRAERASRAHGYPSLDRVRASDYYAQIVATPPGTTAENWMHVARVDEIEAGDVIVWLRPASEAAVNHNSGHSMIAIAPPEPLPTLPGGYLVRVADATSRYHGDDARQRSGQTGFGQGTVLLLAQRQTGGPMGFGRLGRQSEELITSGMAIGRPLR